MSHFCGMLGHALKQEFGALAERVEQEEEGEEQRQAEAVGLPLDERIAWKRVANKRRLKATEFVQDPEASWGNLVWLIIASPILTLRWKLFKHAKWSVEIDTAKEDLGSIIKKFCVPSLNPASDVIDSLLDMLRNSSQALRVAALFHGSLEQWSEQRLKTFQQLVLVASGQLWRKLVMPWLVFPWRLWPLVWASLWWKLKSASRKKIWTRSGSRCSWRRQRFEPPGQPKAISDRRSAKPAATKDKSNAEARERRSQTGQKLRLQAATRVLRRQVWNPRPIQKRARF